MQNGKEYCQSIHLQIRDLLDQAHLGIHERMTLDQLDFGRKQAGVYDRCIWIC